MIADTNDRRLLCEIAYLACVTNRAEQARRILGALEPGSRESVVGGALADLTDGRTDAAIAQLRPLAESGDSYGVTFLGLALKLGGYGAESERVLSRVDPADADVGPLSAALR